MTQVHDRTLALLGITNPPQRSLEALTQWAEQNAITLPASYLEWAAIDNGDLLHKYSNDDHFEFDRPEIVTAPKGVRGLVFHHENQGNFKRMVVLDQGDDPPVLFAEYSKPWTANAAHFSEAIYAQVFDWQYWLAFDDAHPTYKEITYTGDIGLKNDGCMDWLRQHYEETISTQFVWERARYTEYRFITSPTLRLTVMVAGKRNASIRITGRPVEDVQALEAKLTAVFQAKHTT